MSFLVGVHLLLLLMKKKPSFKDKDHDNKNNEFYNHIMMCFISLHFNCIK